MSTLDLAYQHAIDHLAHSHFESLSPLDQELVTIWHWTAAVSNGGFVHLFKSKEGDTAFNAPSALRKIGALQTAALAEEANAPFGSSGPPSNKAERVELLNRFQGAYSNKWDELERKLLDIQEEEDCDELLEAYLGNSPKTLAPTDGPH